MTASLLAALGLPVPARGLPGQAPAGSKQPTGPIRAPGVEPRDELPARRSPAQGNGTSQPPGGSVPTDLRMRPDPIGTGGLPPNLQPKNPGGGSADTPGEPTDAEIATAKADFEKTKLKGAEQLAAVVARIGEKQRRDPLVAVLRDGLTKIQPFVSDAKFKEGLHAALDDLANKGLEKGFVKLIELAIGKTAGEVKRPDTSVPPSGTQPDEAPGEHIVTKDIPFGDAKGNARFVFEGAPMRVMPGQTMTFKVWTPARWSLKDKRWDNTRVIVEAKGSGPKGTTLPSAPFRNKGANEVKLKAPDVAGVYVLYIEAGGIREPSPQLDFEVAPAQAAANSAQAAPPMGAQPAPPMAAQSQKAAIGSPVATKTMGELAELARWPGEAHRAWKKLSTMDRIGLLKAMEKTYGKPFADKFVGFTKGGTVLEQEHYVTALAHQTPQWFESKGYKLAQRSTYQQWWVHPNGHLIFLVLGSTPEELKRALDRIMKSNAKADTDYGVISGLGMSLDYATPLDIVRPADPLDAFNDYVAKLDVLQSFLKGEMNWAAQTRAALVKKGISTTEFDDEVAKLGITQGSVDAMVSNEDDLDPTKDH